MSVAAEKTVPSQADLTLVVSESSPLTTTSTVEDSAVSQRDVVVSTKTPGKTWRDLDALNGDYDKLGPTTTVCPPVNGESPYYERALLVPHEALRFNLLLLERAVQPQYLQVSRQWKVKRVSRWYRERFLPFLHDHHDIEENIIFPRYRQTKGVVVPATINTDHAALLKQLNDISALLQKMETTMDEKPLQEMAEDLRKQVTVMADETREHFAFEEENICPLIKQNMSEEDEKGNVAIVIKQMSFEHLMKELPAVVAGQRRCGGVKMEQAFLAQLPPPPRILYQKFWKSQYEVENVQYISEVCIDSATEPPTKRASCCGCVRYY